MHVPIHTYSTYTSQQNTEATCPIQRTEKIFLTKSRNSKTIQEKTVISEYIKIYQFIKEIHIKVTRSKITLTKIGKYLKDLERLFPYISSEDVKKSFEKQSVNLYYK